MREIIENSIIMRALTAAARWIDSQWERSPVANAFMRKSRGEAAAESSIFTKSARFAHGILAGVFEKLKLDKLFEGSIFANLPLWCVLAVSLAPVVPTMALLALTAVGFVSFVIRLGMDRDMKLVYSPENVFIYLFAAVYLICSVTSVDAAGSIKGGLLTFAFVLFSIVIMNGITTEKQKDALFTGILVGAVIVACYGIAQSFMGVVSEEAWVDDTKFASLSLRVYSTLENPNVLSEYLLLVIPVAASYIFTEKKLYRKVFGIFALGVTVVCILLTYSRGGWLGLLAAAALFLVLIDRRFIVLGIVGIAAALIVMPGSILERFASITDLSDSSTSYRISIWLATLAMLKDYWFCGIGTGVSAFSAVYPVYSFNAITAPHAHNLYLQVICECGISGIVALAGAIFTFFRTCARGIKEGADSKKRLRLIALMSGIFGFLVQSITEYSFYNYRVMMLFWAFIALGAVIARTGKETAE